VYDYRSEWLKLIDLLSQPASAEDVNKRAFDAIAGIFKCSGGALWLKKGKVLAPAYQSNLSVNIAEAIDITSTFQSGQRIFKIYGSYCRLLVKPTSLALWR